jgi:hypothetical protein
VGYAGKLLLALSIPVLVFIIISKKNTGVGQEALTSNKGGPAMMMVVQRAYGYDSIRTRQAVVDCNVPEFYLWTYDHASHATDKISRKDDHLFFLLSQAFGICYYDEKQVDITGPYGFDFRSLLQHLRETNAEASMIRLVEQDSVDAWHSTYRFAGYGPSLTPRWIGIYGDVSKKIYFKTLLRNPAGMLKSFAIQQGIFSIYGPLFPYNVMRKDPNLLVRSGLRTLPTPIPGDPFFAVATLLYALLAWITYGAALIGIPVWLWLTWRKRKDIPEVVVATANPFFLVSIPVLLVALVFSCLVGGENDRYFMQVSPYIIFLAALLPLQWQQIKKLVRV